MRTTILLTFLVAGSLWAQMDSPILVADDSIGIPIELGAKGVAKNTNNSTKKTGPRFSASIFPFVVVQHSRPFMEAGYVFHIKDGNTYKAFCVTGVGADPIRLTDSSRIILSNGSDSIEVRSAGPQVDIYTKMHGHTPPQPLSTGYASVLGDMTFTSFNMVKVDSNPAVPSNSIMIHYCTPGNGVYCKTSDTDNPCKE